MRIVGQRPDGALLVAIGGGLSCILLGQRVSPPVDDRVADRKYGPWAPTSNDFDRRQKVQRQMDRARVTSVFNLCMGEMSFDERTRKVTEALRTKLGVPLTPYAPYASGIDFYIPANGIGERWVVYSVGTKNYRQPYEMVGHEVQFIGEPQEVYAGWQGSEAATLAAMPAPVAPPSEAYVSEVDLAKARSEYPGGRYPSEGDAKEKGAQGERKSNTELAHPNDPNGSKNVGHGRQAATGAVEEAGSGAGATKTHEVGWRGMTGDETTSVARGMRDELQSHGFKEKSIPLPTTSSGVDVTRTVYSHEDGRHAMVHNPLIGKPKVTVSTPDKDGKVYLPGLGMLGKSGETKIPTPKGETKVPESWKPFVKK